jgi:hypothetical protein
MAGIGVVSQLVGFVAQKLLPQPNADNSSANANVRLGKYGEVAVNNYLGKKLAAADEGSYFVTSNPTPGTAITAGPYPTGYASTAGWFFFQNWNAAGGPSAYLDYLKLIVSTPIGGGTITNWNFVVIRDVASSLVTQITTAHYATVNPVNVNGASSAHSGCLLGYQNHATASANIAPSAASAVIGRGSCGGNGTTGAGLVGDEVVLDFGGYQMNAVSGAATAMVQPGRKVLPLPPVVVAPGQQIMIVPWWPTATTSGLAFEFELTHIER